MKAILATLYDSETCEKIRLEFGANLKKIRESKGISQRHLAKIIDSSNATISRWESGQIPHKKNINKLAKALNCSVEDLTNF